MLSYDTSCFCSNRFTRNLQVDLCCNGWRDYALLKTVTREKTLDCPSVHKESNTNNFVGEEPNSKAPSISIEPNVTDFVVTVDDRKLYIRSMV